MATFQTSLYAEGEPRSDFGLGDLFGVQYAGGVEDNGPNGYIRLEHATRHPLLAGLEDTQQVVTSRRCAKVRALAVFPQAPLTRIPTFPTDSMEEIFPTVSRTDIPEVYARELPNGAPIVYFPGDIDASFAGSMAPDPAKLLQNAVNWARKDAAPVRVTGPGLLEVACWRQRSSMTVHMLNCTNPFMLRAAYREDIPVGQQTVEIAIPAGRPVSGVRLLVAGGSPKYEQTGGSLKLTVPTIVDHEVVAVDFA